VADVCDRIPDAPDWAGLQRRALEHGVLPHLLAALAGIGSPAVPPSILGRLRDWGRAHTQTTLFRTGELLEVLALFEAHAIDAVPLKGPVLAMSMYRSLAMRQFTDIDLLVPSSRAAAAAKLLVTRGYAVGSPAETSTAAVRDCACGRVVIDLQWALAEERYSFPITAGRLAADAQRVPFMNTTVWQPRPDDQLLFLCGHAAKHCWSRLGWVSDIAAFIRAHGQQLDWGQTLDRARQMRGERLLLLGLQLAADLLWISVPRDVLPRLRADTVVAPLAAELRHRLFGVELSAGRLNGSYGVVEAGLLYMRSRERLADKAPYARYLLRTLLTWCRVRPNPQDRAVVALPSCLAFLYVVIRPIRLLHKYGGRLLTCGLEATRCWR
jgi:hypothetical protein